MPTNALIAWPVVFSAGSYVLRVSISGVAADCTFTVTADRYYWSAGDGQADASTLGGVGDLLEALETCIETHSSAPTCTVTLTSDFFINVAVAAGTIQILWSHANTTLDPLVFGFADASTATAASVTGTSVPHGLWRAGRPINEDGRPQVDIVGGVNMSLSGAVRVARFGVMPASRDIFFDRLLPATTLTEFATYATSSLEYAWIYGISLGRPFRLYLDETDRTSSSYRLWRTTSLERPWSRAGDFSYRWQARLQAIEVTS